MCVGCSGGYSPMNPNQLTRAPCLKRHCTAKEYPLSQQLYSQMEMVGNGNGRMSETAGSVIKEHCCKSLLNQVAVLSSCSSSTLKFHIILKNNQNHCALEMSHMPGSFYVIFFLFYCPLAYGPSIMRFSHFQTNINVQSSQAVVMLITHYSFICVF